MLSFFSHLLLSIFSSFSLAFSFRLFSYLYPLILTPKSPRYGTLDLGVAPPFIGKKGDTMGRQLWASLIHYMHQFIFCMKTKGSWHGIRRVISAEGLFFYIKNLNANIWHVEKEMAWKK